MLIGVVQEGKAESAAEALQSMMAAKSMVVRNNQQRSITAEEIVVGDILYVQAVRVGCYGAAAALLLSMAHNASRIRG